MIGLTSLDQVIAPPWAEEMLTRQVVLATWALDVCAWLFAARGS